MIAPELMRELAAHNEWQNANIIAILDRLDDFAADRALHDQWPALRRARLLRHAALQPPNPHRSQLATGLHMMGIDYGNTDMPFRPGIGGDGDGGGDRTACLTIRKGPAEREA